jgi:4-carboxymuconolactone decarboxylase
MAKTAKRRAATKSKQKSLADRRAAGLKVLKEIGWGQNEILREVDEDLWELTVDNNFGAIWSRPGLSLRDREMLCIATLVTLGASGVGAHFRNAHAVGLSHEELKEIILQVMPYAGLPKALHAMVLLKKVMEGKPTSL